MKELRKVTMAFLLVCSSLVAIAAADPTMSVSEQPAGIAIGETFTAEVTVDPAGAEIYAVQYDLYFDHTILKATEQTQGTFLSHGGAETYPVVNTVNNTIGKIEYAETRLGDPETVGGATATGVLASITFEAIGEGVSTLTLKDVQYVTPDDLRDPEPTSDLTSDNVDDENPDVSSGSSRTASATRTATPKETLTESTSLPDDSGDTIEDRGATHASGETGSSMAESSHTSSESVPTATHAETPVRPESTIPGFAAASLAIVGLFAVAIILKSRGE